jgi:acetyl esterase
MPVNPSEIKFFEEFSKEQQKQSSKPLSELSIAEFREGANLFKNYVGEAAAVSCEDVKIKSRDGFDIPIRIYNDHLDYNSPVLIFFPGCGYILDLFETNAIVASKIAFYSGMKVIAVNYRLAPEFPLPTPINDGYDVVQHIATHHKQFKIDHNKIFIGGLSSGAHCAAVIANLAQNENKFTIFHQILINGSYDLTQSFHEFDQYEQQDKLFSRDSMPYIWKMWGAKESMYTNPIYSPYFEKNFSKVPATTIIVSEYDGLRNDSESYYKKLKENDVDVDKIVLPGQTHNTIIMREILSDGVDPAEIVAHTMKSKTQQA